MSKRRRMNTFNQMGDTSGGMYEENSKIRESSQQQQMHMKGAQEYGMSQPPPGHQMHE